MTTPAAKTPAAPAAPPAPAPAPAAGEPAPQNVLAGDEGKAPVASPAAEGADDASVLGDDDKGAEGGKDAAAEGKSKDGEAKADELKIELKFPEGFEKDEAVLGEFLPLAKELGLKQEGAQKLADLFVKAQTSAQEKLFAGVADQQKGWANELRTDKEFGGEKFDATVREARRAIEKFGSPELKAFFRDSGLGNHPLLVKAFALAGRGLAEDSSAGKRGGGASQPANTEAARLARLYPTMVSKE